MKLASGISILICVLFTACTSTKKLSKGYFDSKEKVGIVFKLNDFQISKNNSGYGSNALALAISTGIKAAINSTKGDPQSEVNELVKEKNPAFKNELSNLFKEIHDQHQIDYQFIDVDFENLSLPEHEPTMIKRKQAKLDYRSIGQKHDIDYLMIVDIRNYMILEGIGKRVNFTVAPFVINMDDNSFMYVSNFREEVTIVGKWKEAPDYPYLMEIISQNMESITDQIRTKLLSN